MLGSEVGRAVWGSQRPRCLGLGRAQREPDRAQGGRSTQGERGQAPARLRKGAHSEGAQGWHFWCTPESIQVTFTVQVPSREL